VGTTEQGLHLKKKQILKNRLIAPRHIVKMTWGGGTVKEHTVILKMAERAIRT
jgi:hypothetical protein